MNRIVATNHAAVVALRHVSAYRDGCLLDYTAAAKLDAYEPVDNTRSRDELRSLFMVSDGHQPLNFELRLTDGRTSSTLAAVDLRIRATADEHAVVDPEPPVMMGLPGDGAIISGNIIEQHHPVWLWPLPPPDVLRISVNWARYGIHDVAHDIDGAALVAASQSSRSYWDPNGRP
jgi:hypothetical protein